MWWLCIYIRESSKCSKVLFYYLVVPHLMFPLKSVEEGAFHRSFHHISSLAFFIDICKFTLLDYIEGQGHLLALQQEQWRHQRIAWLAQGHWTPRIKMQGFDIPTVVCFLLPPAAFCFLKLLSVDFVNPGLEGKLIFDSFISWEKEQLTPILNHPE